jgi:hypothetical protein
MSDQASPLRDIRPEFLCDLVNVIYWSHDEGEHSTAFVAALLLILLEGPAGDSIATPHRHRQAPFHRGSGE